jgi:c-di-GMP-binding flagellar brake protein YcgR
MKPRMSERFPVRIDVIFSTVGMDTEAKGTITDLSKGGCRAESHVPPKAGAEVRLSIMMPDYAWPLKVDRAIVRWMKHRYFGIEFLSMHSSQRDRLARFIMRVKQERDY